jgi:hypothetical protein
VDGCDSGVGDSVAVVVVAVAVVAVVAAAAAANGQVSKRAREYQATDLG